MATKYSFLVIKYPWPDTADDALAALKELSDEKVVKLRDAVAIRKTEKGKIRIEQTKDDSIGKGFVKGGVIGVLFAVLFGPAGWIAMGAAAGGLFAGFDRGIKNKLLKELGENLTPMESAVAILVEHADWPTAVERMKAHGFQGELVISEIVPEDMDEVEALLEDPKKVESVPDEVEILAVAAAVVAQAAADEAPEVAPVVEAPADATEVPQGGGARIADIEGIGPVHADLLLAMGIRTTDELLAAGATPGGRKGIADSTGISDKLVLGWINKADLMRIPGVGSQYSDLLEAAGVDSPAELARRNPANLQGTFQEVVAARPGIVRRIPSESEVAGWIDEAGTLAKVGEH